MAKWNVENTPEGLRSVVYEKTDGTIKACGAVPEKEPLVLEWIAGTAMIGDVVVFDRDQFAPGLRVFSFMQRAVGVQ